MAHLQLETSIAAIPQECFDLSLAVDAHTRSMAAPHRFVDEQTRGPLSRWIHEHRSQPTGDGRTLMTDRIPFASPAGPAGRLVDRLFLAGYLRRLVETRNDWLKQALEDGRGDI